MSINLRNAFKNTKIRNVLSTVAVATLLSACVIRAPGGGGSGPADNGPTVDINQPVKVALLVPNGGGNGNLNAIGNSLANAGRLAENRLNNGEIELMVYSTGGDPARAAQLAAQAQSDGAKLIIGPLKSEEAAAAASQSGLPIMSFSNNSEIAGNNIYVLGTTFETIADRVIDYQKSQGGKRLGVVYPNDIGGQQGAKSTIAAANTHRIEVVANEPYTLTQQDISSAAPGIAGRLQSSGADMVMLTDNPAGGLSFIAIALKDNGISGANTNYLGLARWADSAQALSNAGLNGGIFAEPDPARRLNFESQYNSAYGSSPHQLAGLGFDGVAAAIQLVRNARKKNDATPFSTRDISKVSFIGANGAVEMNGNAVTRGMAVMKLQNGTAVIVSRAPESF